MSLICRLMLRRIGIVATHRVTIRRNIKVRTPDGVELLTDLYLGNPAGAPAIIVRSPYGKSVLLASIMAYPLASQGFNVAFQSCRGMFGSTGTFNPHHDEQRDGLATVEWVKRQPWCNGRIATSGGSYLGYTQWAVAAAAGADIQAMALQITQSDFSRMTYNGHSFALQNALSWTAMTMKSQRRFSTLRTLLSRLRGAPSIRAEQWRHLPLGTIDAEVTGKPVPFWQDWMQHSSAEDPWWAPMGFYDSIPRIKQPITMTSGWFDIFAPGQMRDFVALRQAGCEVRITVGPWQHTDAEQLGAAMHDAIDWFNQHLLGKAGAPRPKRVKLFVMGANEWRYFDEWPPRESVAERWHLQPQRDLRRATPTHSPADEYRYDPGDPTPSVGGPALEGAVASVDNGMLEARADVLTYTSEPLTQARDIVGTVTAELYVSSSAASADFFVRICDVDAAGISKNICDGLRRVTIESGGAPQRVTFELWPTAYRIARGNRIRVQVSSGAFPRWARNLGGLEPLATATELRTATQTIHHSPTHASAVIVPFGADPASPPC